MPLQPPATAKGVDTTRETIYEIINIRPDLDGDADTYEPLEMCGHIISGSIITDNGTVIEFDEFYPCTQISGFAAFAPHKPCRTDEGSAQSVPVYINAACVKTIIPSHAVYKAFEDEAYPAHLLPSNQKGIAT